MKPVQLSAAYSIRGFCKHIGLLCLLATLKAHGCKLSDNGNGTMTVPSSGLLIRSCAMGENWTGSSCTGTSTGYTWQSAMQNFSTGVWRLMTKEEAAQIAPNAKTCWTVTGGAWNASWTSTPDPNDDTVAHIAGFKVGLVGIALRDNKKDVRLVSTGGNQGNGIPQNSCDREERNALAAPGTRSDLRPFLEGNIQNMDTGNLTQRLESARARAAELPSAALFVCLAARELRARMSPAEKIPDDAKTIGHGARGG